MSRRRQGNISSPEYRWYLVVQVISIVGTMMGYTALYWLTLRVGHGNGLALAVIIAVKFIPVLLFSRRAGLLVGRHRAVRVVMITQLLLGLSSLAIGIPLLLGYMSIWYLAALSLVIGCIGCVDVPARQNFMFDLLGPDELRRGSSLYGTVTGLAKIAGPGVAGAIIAFSGEALVFVIDGASYLGVIVVLACLSRNVRYVAKEKVAKVVSARRFRWVLDLPHGVQMAVLMAFLVGGIGLQFSVTNPLMATKVLHLNSLGFGLLGTFIAVGGVAGNYYSSRRKDPGSQEFLAWALAFGIAELIAGIVPVIWAYDVSMIVVGAATQLFAVSSTVYVQQTTPAAQRGMALSAYNAGFMGFVPAGAFIVAGIGAIAGVRWALIGPGLAIVACAMMTLLSARRSTVQVPVPAVTSE